jgi:hypothetical protein
MEEQIVGRLVGLKKELEKGQSEPQKGEKQRTYLHETVFESRAT